MNQHRRPIWFAALATAWSVPLVLALLSTLAIRLGGGSDRFGEWGVLTGLVALILPLTYVGMLVFSLPYVLWLRARQDLTWSHVCAGTVISSVIAVLAYSLLVSLQIELGAVSTLLSASLGMLSGLVFCIAAGISFRSSARRTGAA